MPTSVQASAVKSEKSNPKPTLEKRFPLPMVSSSVSKSSLLYGPVNLTSRVLMPNVPHERPSERAKPACEGPPRCGGYVSCSKEQKPGPFRDRDDASR